jgi:toxin ParE1/3/4
VKTRIRVSEQAELDLEEIEYQTEELFGVNQTIALSLEFDRALKLLTENPNIGRKRDDLSFGKHLFRSWPVLGRFLIVYEVAEEWVTIERILDGTQDLKNLFREW